MQVAGTIREKIINGEYGVGEMIPREDDLIQEYSVSRGTVKEALRILKVEGILELVQGKGTFVRNKPLVL